jgi:hypothetical protein
MTTAPQTILSTLLGLLSASAADLAMTMCGDFEPGEVHLAGPARARALAAEPDHRLDALLHEIQRRRRHH